MGEPATLQNADRRPRLFGKAWTTTANVLSITVNTDEPLDVDTEVIVMGRGRVVKTIFDDEKGHRIDVVKLDGCEVARPGVRPV